MPRKARTPKRGALQGTYFEIEEDALNEAGTTRDAKQLMKSRKWMRDELSDIKKRRGISAAQSKRIKKMVRGR